MRLHAISNSNHAIAATLLPISVLAANLSEVLSRNQDVLSLIFCIPAGYRGAIRGGAPNMNFAELTQSRRTVHNYKSTKVEDSWVEEALHLALWAPNHKLTFPWAFFWVGPRVRAELADLTIRLKESKEPLSEIKKKATRENVLSPSHLMLMGLRRGDPGRLHEDYATLACSVQIIMSSLWEKGVGTKWSTGGNYGHSETYKMLGISPAEFSLEGGLLIGAPLMIPTAPKRPPLERFLRRTD